MMSDTKKNGIWSINVIFFMHFPECWTWVSPNSAITDNTVVKPWPTFLSGTRCELCWHMHYRVTSPWLARHLFWLVVACETNYQVLWPSISLHLPKVTKTCRFWEQKECSCLSTSSQYLITLSLTIFVFSDCQWNIRISQLDFAFCQFPTPFFSLLFLISESLRCFWHLPLVLDICT